MAIRKLEKRKVRPGTKIDIGGGDPNNSFGAKHDKLGRARAMRFFEGKGEVGVDGYKDRRTEKEKNPV